MPAWQGTLRVAPGHALYVGPAGETRPHRHHAHQLTVGLEGPLQVQVEAAAREAVGAVLIAWNVGHRIDGRGRAVGIYYVDASSTEGRGWSRWLRGEAAQRLSADADALRQVFADALARPSPATLAAVRSRIAETLSFPPSPRSEVDALVSRAMALLEQRLGNPPSMPELARGLGVRQRELSARFLRETGLTIRRYVLWLRVQAAIAALAHEGTLTQVAHRAGFADAAHLSRTFAEMFGVSPSRSIAASRIELLGSG